MSKRAYYSEIVSDFLLESTDSVIGKITQNHPQSLEYLQTGAWATQVEILQSAINGLHEGHIFFEFQIPRMGRRADVLLIYKDLIFVIEFKVGAHRYLPQDKRQAHGYAIDLHHFHEGSHHKTIIPILVATEAEASPLLTLSVFDDVYEPICTNSSGLQVAINACNEQIKPKESIHFETWMQSAYKPTPTIIEAAQALYSNHDVNDISRNDAGAQNLHSTTQAIQNIIHDSKIRNRKTICFVTGVPGAGKTLAGLNIATFNTNTEDDEHAVFLSGNGPLVDVLREALARDRVERDTTTTKADALRQVTPIIQNIHHFRDHYLKHNEERAEKIVIFDEAQRAWDLENTSKFMVQKRQQKSFDQSEPEFLISVMNRHENWCVIVALIGGGQEINTGEAGLQGWIDAISAKYPNWDVHYSDKLTQIEYAGSINNFEKVAHTYQQVSLHLATSMRSFRAEKLSHMIHYLIHNQADLAKAHCLAFKDRFPIKITRDLELAKNWIQKQSRGNQTKGVIASSGAIRLKPEGIYVKNRISAPDWFLNDQEDVRSCHYLEDVATEFDIQGLELDWCLVGWDADYRYVDGKFEHWKFTGTTWKQRQQDIQKRYLENAYRVLLTRARQGMVIFMPVGNEDDNTRLPKFYNDTFDYLVSCGAEVLN
ncbi:MAG TPA: DUF2075 domain-containing protein [Burkholderiaceae bacterium]|nr:DUF2075 domain-containing protein [Burkholderiaceae bacterium]